MPADRGRTAVAARDLRETVRAGSLEVDRAPVTNARYAVFVRDTGHRAPVHWPGRVCPRSLADHPVVAIDFFDAVAFALWAGGALPTELEWVEATGLAEHRAYVWGDKFDPRRCNTVRSGVKGTTPVGAYPHGTAPSGCLDMCGNVWEMTCSSHPGDHESIIVKGGSWYDFPVHAQIDARFRTPVSKCLSTVGFRLVYGRPPRFPGFLDAQLVARCIRHRQAGVGRQPAPTKEFDEFHETVAQLREEAKARSAGPTLTARFRSDAVEEALALLDDPDARVTTGARPPRRVAPRVARPPPPPGGRLAATLRRLGRADFWRRLRPAWRAFRSRRGERTLFRRVRAATTELRRWQPTKQIRRERAAQALRAAQGERTLPQRLGDALAELGRSHGGPTLWESLWGAAGELTRRRRGDG
ncbi:MAG: formylglycine-generating enzyme family protein [Planctomycetota bacterium]|jgi:hypothetical protein